MNKISQNKYKEIIIAVALFVILDAGILFLNYFKSYEIAKDAHAIQLASRQTTLTQKMLHQLYQIRDDLLTKQPTDNSVEKLTESFSQFDEAMDSFIYGGELIGQGQEQDSLLLDNRYSEDNKETLDAIEKAWQPYRARVSAVVYATYDKDLDKNALLNKTSKAITVGRQNNNKLLTLTTQFAQDVEKIAQEKASHLRTIQTVGIILAIINFFVVLFHFLRKLKASDKKAEKSQQQTSEILATVNDGLFLIDKRFNILPQHSASLHTLLQQREIANKNFLQTIAPMVSNKTQSVAEQYLQNMFSNHVEPELLADLNPLTEVEAHLTTHEGHFETRYFSFNFTPVYEEKHLIHLLVIVRDISERVLLQNQLEKSKHESSQQLHDLISVIHLNHETFLGFLSSLKKALKHINEILKRPAYLNKQYQKKITMIARITHRLKGDATAVGFTPLQQSLHKLEDVICELIDQKKLEGNDFLPITVELNALDHYVESLSHLVGHVVGFKKEITQQHNGDQKSESHDNFQALQEQSQRQFIELSKKMASEYHKKVHLDVDHYHVQDIPKPLFESIQSMIIQLLRNAIVHGIENSQTRKKLGKKSQATISITTEKTQDKFSLKFRDDGQGIDLKAIKQKLINKYNMSTLQTNSMTQSHLISYLFKSGFSTVKNVDMNAGRGIGLELVKNIVKEHQAKLKIDFKHHAYTEFIVIFSLPINHDNTHFSNMALSAA